MPAFADVSELTLYAESLRQAGIEGEERTREFIRTEAGPDLVDKMREEVPRDSDDTYDSIEAQYDADGLGVSVGPTNRDEKGRPVGYFIEHGTNDTTPDPFVLRTAMWAERTMPGLADDIVRDIL